jgi:hypothetical protein
MSRRPAIITQADVARACRAARQLGPEWFIEIEAVTGTIRVMQIPPPHDRPQPPERDPESQFARGLANTP